MMQIAQLMLLSGLSIGYMLVQEVPQTTTPTDTSASTAAPAAMQFPDAVTATGFPEGTQFATAAQSQWKIGKSALRIVVPNGFVTDFASIPPKFQWLLATQGSYSRAAVIHDYLYWTQTCTRSQSDNLFMIAMIESGVPWTQRHEIYGGVQIGGDKAWTANANEKARGLGKFVPARYRSQINTMSWDQLRLYLARNHIKDPASTITREICALGNSTAVP